jgi:hypothetical protein
MDKKFTFDSVLPMDVPNEIMYDQVAKKNIDAFLRGYNATIFAYGQTGSGKTYTMLGSEIVEANLLTDFSDLDIAVQK